MDAETHAGPRNPKTLPACAAMIPEATTLNGAPHRGWYFTVMVRAAYSRLEGVAQ